MNNSNHSKIAKENIIFLSDKTWINHPESLSYQKANLVIQFTALVPNDLYRLIEIVPKSTLDIRPRTVNDCIPYSRLASYSNSFYDECRELSYRVTFGPNTPIERLSEKYKDYQPKEPWMLAEIDDLLEWFVTADNEPMTEQHFCLKNFESPLMRTFCFDEKVLKMRLTSEKVQSIWETPIVQDTATVVCKSFTNHYFCEKFKEQFTNTYHHHPQISPEIEQSEEFKALNSLSKSFQEQSSFILNLYNEMPTKNAKLFQCKPHKFQSDPLTNSKRLYSAVLQGVNQTESAVESSEQSSRPEMIILSKEYPKYFSKTSCKCANCENKVPITGSGNFPALRPNLFLPLIFHNRQLFQAPIFYPHNLTLKTCASSPVWSVSNQFVPPNPVHLVVHNQTIHSPRFSPPPKTNTVPESRTNCRTFEGKQDTENCIPVRNSVSEELEIQALEQYASCNNEIQSVLEDLEQQAAEQYDNF